MPKESEYTLVQPPSPEFEHSEIVQRARLDARNRSAQVHAQLPLPDFDIKVQRPPIPTIKLDWEQTQAAMFAENLLHSPTVFSTVKIERKSNGLWEGVIIPPR